MEIRWVSDRVITVELIYEEDVLRLICWYSLRSGKCIEEKQSFYDELKSECNMYSVDDLVVCLG